MEALFARSLNLSLVDSEDVRAPGLEVGYLFLVNIKPRHLEAGTAEEKGKWQSYISKTNHANFGAAGLQALQTFLSDTRQGEFIVGHHKKNYCILPAGMISVFADRFIPPCALDAGNRLNEPQYVRQSTLSDCACGDSISKSGTNQSREYAKLSTYPGVSHCKLLIMNGFIWPAKC